MNELRNINIRELKGVGPKKEQLLNKINIFNVYDLLTYYPRSYDDYSNFKKIEDLVGDKGLMKLKVISPPNLRYIRSNMNILKVGVTDGKTNGELVFFNQHFLKNYFKIDYTIQVFGTVKRRRYNYEITNARLLKKSEIGRFHPIYNLTQGLSNNEIKNFISQALKKYENLIFDFLTEDLLKNFQLIDKKTAITNIHFPKNKRLLDNSLRRLAFEELLVLQIALDKNSFRSKSCSSPKINLNNHLEEINNFIDNLPFSLTNAQKRVFNEISLDMISENGLNRLLQGDVGSGKTVIAALAILLTSLNNKQSAFMAPTEILAKQHYQSVLDLFENYDINISLLTGDIKDSEKKKITKDLKEGNIDVIIGTHALIQDTVEFKDLALTIIDEQHRFGVEQRKTLYEKGNHPHNLSMTATPIPRTLALVLYGDMEISIIDELPPGRKPVDTYAVDESYIARLDKFVVKQIKEGRQVFIVCPLIEENDMPLRSLEEVFEHYSSNYFTKENIKAAYLHGKMKNSDKSEIMNEFVKNNVQILVSTTVIEVGVNVPNANLMIIYNADRFGLSQLHQLRGRVGRGSDKAYCVLINNNPTEISYRRMKIMTQSNDGFYIADKDLELRGQGELLGNRQHGISELKIANLKFDTKLIETIQKNYKDILGEIKKDKFKYNELSSAVTLLIDNLNSIKN